MTESGKLTRDVTPSECSWLSKSYPAGTIVYRFDGCTYGAVSPRGVAVSLVPGEYPFFELPKNAVVWG